MYTECPISYLFDQGCKEVYRLIKQTLLSEFSSFLPSDLLNELNIYSVYREVISSAEYDYDKTKKD